MYAFGDGAIFWMIFVAAFRFDAGEEERGIPAANEETAAGESGV